MRGIVAKRLRKVAYGEWIRLRGEYREVYTPRMVYKTVKVKYKRKGR